MPKETRTYPKLTNKEYIEEIPNSSGRTSQELIGTDMNPISAEKAGPIENPNKLLSILFGLSMLFIN